MASAERITKPTDLYVSLELTREEVDFLKKLVGCVNQNGTHSAKMAGAIHAALAPHTDVGGALGLAGSGEMLAGGVQYNYVFLDLA
jgi:hypothetical protein